MTRRESGRRPRIYEIRVAGAIGERLRPAFAGMRAAEVGPLSLLRIESDDVGDAADIALRLRECGYAVSSVRRCGPWPDQEGGAVPEGPLRIASPREPTVHESSKERRRRE